MSEEAWHQRLEGFEEITRGDGGIRPKNAHSRTRGAAGLDMEYNSRNHAKFVEVHACGMGLQVALVFPHVIFP